MPRAITVNTQSQQIQRRLTITTASRQIQPAAIVFTSKCEMMEIEKRSLHEKVERKTHNFPICIISPIFHSTFRVE